MKLHKKLLESLHCEYANNEIQKLDEENILEQIIPEIKEMKLVGECKYHVVNAYDHSINALEEFENMLRQENFLPIHLNKSIIEYLDTNLDSNLKKLQILKLGVFLHDIGKPKSRTVDSTGRAHFKGHEKTGAEIGYKLGEELGLTAQETDLLRKYIKNHMVLLALFKSNDMSEAKLFEVFDKLGEDTIGIILLGYADIIATIRLIKSREELGVVKTYMEYALTNYFYKYKNK